MTKERDALKLALEALEYISSHYMSLPKIGCMALAALEEALAENALERMADNARELGLDYEPPCKTGSQCTSKCQQCEQPAQEPVAWHDKIKGMEVSMDVSTGEDDIHHRIYGRVYEVILEDGEGTPNAILAIEEDRNFTSPQPAQPSKPLTHESIAPVRRFLADRGIYLSDETTKALIEAAHGIKE